MNNYEVAGVLRRIVGGVVDLLVMLAIIAFVFYFFGPKDLFTQPHAIAKLPEQMAMYSAWLAGLVLGIFIFFAVLEAVSGKTLGKFVAGTAVLDIDQGSASAKQALARNLFRCIDGIMLYAVGLLFILLTSKNQRLGDLFARTIVVRCPRMTIAR